MTLIKLSEDHYIVADDSEINIGDIVAERLLTGKYDLFTIHTLNDIDKLRQKKIICSTQPESLGTGWMQSVLPLLLSEVKELIGEVNKVEELSLKMGLELYVGGNYDFENGVRKGYNQALEDNKEKKYTEEDMQWALYEARHHQEHSIEEIIQALQPKTEWEVEFVNGKLKLKS